MLHPVYEADRADDSFAVGTPSIGCAMLGTTGRNARAFDSADGSHPHLEECDVQRHPPRWQPMPDGTADPRGVLRPLRGHGKEN
jgi:hypothetical protein